MQGRVVGEEAEHRTDQREGEHRDQLRREFAQEIIANDRNSAGAYATLAQLAYQANQLRKGDLARDKAIELTEPDMRESLKGQLESARAQAAAAAATPTPSPEATKTPKPDDEK